MEWEWKGKEDKADKSGVLSLQFSTMKTSIALNDFDEASHLAQSICDEIKAAERRGKSEAVEMFRKLCLNIVCGA